MESNYIEIKGVRIHYYQENKAANNCLFYIHGNSLSAATFEKQLNSKELSEYRMIALDLPGCGQSEKLNHYSLQKLSELLVEFILKLELKSIILVGHSLGGDLSIQILEELGEIKGSFIFGSSPAKIPIQLSEMFLPNEAANLALNATLTREEVRSLASNFSFKGKLLEQQIASTDGNFRTGIAASIFSQEYKDEVEIINATEKPIAFVVGENDPLINKEFLKTISFKSLYKNKLMIIKGGSHSPQIDNLEAFNNLLQAFAQSVFK